MGGSVEPWRAPVQLDGLEPGWPISRLESLAYVVGVVLKGDGCVYLARVRPKNGSHRDYAPRCAISIRANSTEFVDLFREQCAVALKREPVKRHGPYADGCYTATFTSVDFYRWWSRSTMAEIEEFVSCFPRHYLRGRFDSEAGVGAYAVYMFGAANHIDVLELDRRMCIRLGMRTGELLPYGKVGSESTIHGRLVVNRVQKLRFSVNAQDFIAKLGALAIPRRNSKLTRMIRGRRWTPWSEEIRDLALMFHSQGLNHASIAQRLEHDFGVVVPKMTIYTWLHGGHSWKEFSRASNRF
jgi:intein-encoded DNA endonuclease-like protein